MNKIHKGKKMSKKKIILILAAAIIIVGCAYLFKTGIIVVNLHKTALKDPVSGQAVTQEDLANKSAHDLYTDAIELNKKGDYDQASAFLNSAMQKDNNETNVNVLRELAVSYYNLKKYLDAIATYLKITEINPENTSAFNELGNVYRDSGDKAKAEESYRKAIETDMSYILAYNNLAMMFVQDNNVDAAKNVIQDGLNKNQNNSELEKIMKSLEVIN